MNRWTLHCFSQVSGGFAQQAAYQAAEAMAAWSQFLLSALAAVGAPQGRSGLSVSGGCRAHDGRHCTSPAEV